MDAIASARELPLCYPKMSPHLYSIPLTSHAEDLSPTGIGSGALIEVEKCIVLLGVRHVVQRNSRWACMLKYVPGKGSKEFKFGTPTFVREFTPAVPKGIIHDFFCVLVEEPIAPRHQVVEGINAISSDVPKKIFGLGNISEPDADRAYTFFGLTQPKLEGHFFERTITEQGELMLDRIEDERLVFKLPNKHPGHQHFRGCSGAPIVDENDNLVGLVMGGCEDRDEIFALHLNRFKDAIVDVANG